MLNEILEQRGTHGFLRITLLRRRNRCWLIKKSSDVRTSRKSRLGRVSPRKNHMLHTCARIILYAYVRACARIPKIMYNFRCLIIRADWHNYGARTTGSSSRISSANPSPAPSRLSPGGERTQVFSLTSLLRKRQGRHCRKKMVRVKFLGVSLAERGK